MERTILFSEPWRAAIGPDRRPSTADKRREFDVITLCELAIGSELQMPTRSIRERVKIPVVASPVQHATC